MNSTSLPIHLGIPISKKSLGCGFSFEDQTCNFIKSPIFNNDITSLSLSSQEIEFTIIKDQNSLHNALGLKVGDIYNNQSTFENSYINKIMDQFGLIDGKLSQPNKAIIVYKRINVSSIDILNSNSNISQSFIYQQLQQPLTNILEDIYYIKKLEYGSKGVYIITLESDCNTIELIKKMTSIKEFETFLNRIEAPSYKVDISSYTEGFKAYTGGINCIGDIMKCLESLEIDKKNQLPVRIEVSQVPLELKLQFVPKIDQMPHFLDHQFIS